MQGGQETSVTAIVVAGAISTVLFWLLTYFAPGLMATAPDTLEPALGTLVMAALCYYLPAWGAPEPKTRRSKDELIVDDEDEEQQGA